MEDIGRDCLVATYSQRVIGLILDPVFLCLEAYWSNHCVSGLP